MNKFIINGNKITRDLVEALNTIAPDHGFLIGGGLGYQSKKYNDLKAVGDYDFIVVVDNVKSIKNFISDFKLLENIGFYKDSLSEYFEEDTIMFENGKVSIIGFKGTIGENEVSINFTTEKHLAEVMLKNKSVKFYKALHKYPFNPFLSRGSNGEELIACRFTPQVDYLYSNKTKNHFLTPHDTWYKNGSYIHLGIHADFISKGTIYKDSKMKIFERIQSHIYKILKTHSSENIYNSKDWNTMFANSKYFSNEYLELLNNKINNIPASFIENKYKVHNNRDIICIFADEYYYKESHNELRFIQYEDQLPIEFMEYLTMLDLEIKNLIQFIGNNLDIYKRQELLDSISKLKSKKGFENIIKLRQGALYFYDKRHNLHYQKPDFVY